MSKKWIILLVVAIILVSWTVVRFSSPEDAWLCQNGQWVKHGNPADPAPTSGCGQVSQSPQQLAEAYIRAHISELSPIHEVLGGKFYVTKVSFPEANKAAVEYEDGHIALKADVAYSVENNEVSVASFVVDDPALTQSMMQAIGRERPELSSTPQIEVLVNTGSFAKGSVRFAGSAGLWFAAKTDKGWELVYDGNGIIPCAAANKYNLPKDLAPQCIDTAHNNNLVQR